jgi:hypothetical protein
VILSLQRANINLGISGFKLQQTVIYCHQSEIFRKVAMLLHSIYDKNHKEQDGVAMALYIDASVVPGRNPGRAVGYTKSCQGCPQYFHGIQG